MKVSISVRVTYSYTIDIPEDIAPENLLDVADTEDPVYEGISRILHNERAIDDYDASTISIIDDETGEYLYEEY